MHSRSAGGSLVDLLFHVAHAAEKNPEAPLPWLVRWIERNKSPEAQAESLREWRDLLRNHAVDAVLAEERLSAEEYRRALDNPASVLGEASRRS